MVDWSTLRPILQAFYVGVSLALSGYGLYYLAVTLARLRLGPHRTETGWNPGEPPRVTVQLPVYNEIYVVERILSAVAAFDWPRDRLEVQLIDDSDDETRDVAARLVGQHQARGLDVRHLTRPARDGFKAGALNHGLAHATGDYVTVFDADFVPPQDFLNRVMPDLGDPRVACVQTRWQHLDEHVTTVSRALTFGLEAHFDVEQRVRDANGFVLSFNGTSCVWRRAALEAAGGWPTGTLAEDLDLTLVVMRAGWRLRYRHDVAVPCEVPIDANAFKRQQFRWARGSAQGLRRHAIGILRSPHMSPMAKADAFLHLGHYAIHPLMLALFLLQAAFLVETYVDRWFLLATGTAMTLGPVAMFVVSQRSLHPDRWRRRLVRLVPLTLLGIGISLRNTRAVIGGLAGFSGRFERTPKFGVDDAHPKPRGAAYRLAPDWMTVLEGVLGVAFLGVAGLAVVRERWAALPTAALAGVAFLMVFLLSMRRRHG